MRVVMVEISPPFRINAKIARMAIPMSARYDISGSEEHGKKRKSDHQLIDALLF